MRPSWQSSRAASHVTQTTGSGRSQRGRHTPTNKSRVTRRECYGEGSGVSSGSQVAALQSSSCLPAKIRPVTLIQAQTSKTALAVPKRSATSPLATHRTAMDHLWPQTLLIRGNPLLILDLGLDSIAANSLSMYRTAVIRAHMPKWDTNKRASSQRFLLLSS